MILWGFLFGDLLVSGGAAGHNHATMVIDAVGSDEGGEALPSSVVGNADLLSAGGAGRNDDYERALRPENFDQYVGQEEVKANLKVFTSAAKGRGETLDHTLFYGPPGLGKTTLALICAAAMGAQMRQTAGPALEKPADLASILTNLQAGDVLFVDEIHRLRLPVEEVLYTAMEDFAIDIIVGKGPTARTMRIEVPPFTLIGATTKASLLSGPLRDRFGHIEKLRYYSVEELGRIVTRSAGLLGVEIDPTAAQTLAENARRTPRIANRLLRRLRDFAQIEGMGRITHNLAVSALQRLGVSDGGLDYGDREYLSCLCDKFSGGPVGISTLAAATGEDRATLEDMIEPFLIRQGFLTRTPRGRQATPRAMELMGVKIVGAESQEQRRLL